MTAVTVVAVVVAFNRRELLAQTLQSLTTQTRQPNSIVVIDNASSDGTSAMVAAEFPQVELITLDRNTAVLEVRGRNRTGTEHRPHLALGDG